MSRETRVINRLAANGMTHLLDAAAKRWCVNVADIVGKDRHLGPTLARHGVWWEVRHSLSRTWSYPEIAALFEVDHSTVISGVAKYARRVERAIVPQSAVATHCSLYEADACM